MGIPADCEVVEVTFLCANVVSTAVASSWSEYAVCLACMRAESLRLVLAPDSGRYVSSIFIIVNSYEEQANDC